MVRNEGSTSSLGTKSYDHLLQVPVTSEFLRQVDIRRPVQPTSPFRHAVVRCATWLKLTQKSNEQIRLRIKLWFLGSPPNRVTL